MPWMASSFQEYIFPEVQLTTLIKNYYFPPRLHAQDTNFLDPQYASIWMIILTELSINLIRHEPLDPQNDSISLFNQGFLHFDNTNL